MTEASDTAWPSIHPSHGTDGMKNYSTLTSVWRQFLPTEIQPDLAHQSFAIIAILLVTFPHHALIECFVLRLQTSFGHLFLLLGSHFPPPSDRISGSAEISIPLPVVRFPIAYSLTPVDCVQVPIQQPIARIDVRGNSFLNHSGPFCRLPDSILSPVNVNILNSWLSFYPDQVSRQFLIHGFSFGFDIGFSGPVSDSRPNNLLSARNNPSGVLASISKEVSRGHTAGPF